VCFSTWRWSVFDPPTAFELLSAGARPNFFSLFDASFRHSWAFTICERVVPKELWCGRVAPRYRTHRRVVCICRFGTRSLDHVATERASDGETCTPWIQCVTWLMRSTKQRGDERRRDRRCACASHRTARIWPLAGSPEPRSSPKRHTTRHLDERIIKKGEGKTGREQLSVDTWSDKETALCCSF